MCGRASGVPGAKGWHEGVDAALGDKNPRGKGIKNKRKAREC